jgi:hypothetical protein
MAPVPRPYKLLEMSMALRVELSKIPFQSEAGPKKLQQVASLP